MEDPTPCGGLYKCPNGTECREEWEVRTYFYNYRVATILNQNLALRKGELK